MAPNKKIQPNRRSLAAVATNPSPSSNAAVSNAAVSNAAVSNASDDTDTLGEQANTLNLFCARSGDAWRLHAAPQGLPLYLRGYFDAHHEAYPVDLDLDDLDRFMGEHGADYERRESHVGGVEITARGGAAARLAEWLSNMFSSTVRVRR